MKTTAILSILTLNFFWLAAAHPCGAQAAPLPSGQYLRLAYDANADAVPTSAINGESSAADPASPAPPQGGTPQPSATSDNQWHLAVSPYLWLPGVHGTVGAFGREAGFRASASDLLSKFRFGLLGAVEARRNRILTTTDLMFMRLKDDKAIPFPPGLGSTSANVTANMFILTPKIGIRLINQEKFKADFLTGIRYWHLSENVDFNPSLLGLNFSRSQNLVDPLVGGRIEAALSPKVVTIIAGDVGGWGTGSQLEYQVVGLLGYKLKPAMTLQAGYRYLYINYEKGGSANSFVNLAMSGVVLGVTLNLK